MNDGSARWLPDRRGRRRGKEVGAERKVKVVSITIKTAAVMSREEREKVLVF